MIFWEIKLKEMGNNYFEIKIQFLTLIKKLN